MSEALPIHDEVGWRTRAIELTALAVAFGLVGALVVRFARTPELRAWWVPFAALAGVALADFVSGIVHWIADTWGQETMPVLGRRFLRPFRVHHVNPDDFLRRGFLDCNGDVAALTAPFLAAALLLPLDHLAGRVTAVLLAGFGSAGLLTNQVHQWAHMPHPPRPVRGLQRCGLLLSGADHARHHAAPYATNYCITTGWCNRPLAAVGFFPALERTVTRLTGLRPRDDDRAFAEQTWGTTGGPP